MKRRKGKLSKAQQRIVDKLLTHDGSFIQAMVNDLGCEWNYIFAKPTDMRHSTTTAILLIKVEGVVFKVCRLPYHKNQETIKCLIHKKVLTPTMSNKEFAIQLALGTADHRVYKLPKDCVNK